MDVCVCVCVCACVLGLASSIHHYQHAVTKGKGLHEIKAGGIVAVREGLADAGCVDAKVNL